MNKDVIYAARNYTHEIDPTIILNKPMTIIDFIEHLDKNCWLFCTLEKHGTDAFDFKYNYYDVIMDPDLTCEQRIQAVFREKLKLRKLSRNKQEILNANYDFMIIYIDQYNGYRISAERQPDGSYYFQAWIAADAADSKLLA